MSLGYFTRVGDVAQATLIPASAAHLLDGGRYFVTQRAIDANGLPTTPATSTGVTIDLTSLAVSLTAPTPGSLTSQRLVIAAASDTISGVAAVQCQRSDDGSNWTNLGTPESAAPFQIAPAAADLADGPQQLRAIATDRAGNSAISPAVAFTLDTTPPIAAVTTPISGGLTNQRLLVANVTDAVCGVASVQFQQSADGVTVGIWVAR